VTSERLQPIADAVAREAVTACGVYPSAG